MTAAWPLIAHCSLGSNERFRCATFEKCAKTVVFLRRPGSIPSDHFPFAFG
jgi:hypothetical protein